MNFEEDNDIREGDEDPEFSGTLGEEVDDDFIDDDLGLVVADDEVADAADDDEEDDVAVADL